MEEILYKHPSVIFWLMTMIVMALAGFVFGFLLADMRQRKDTAYRPDQEPFDYPAKKW